MLLVQKKIKVYGEKKMEKEWVLNIYMYINVYICLKNYGIF